jgi:hypothetical protein
MIGCGKIHAKRNVKNVFNKLVASAKNLIADIRASLEAPALALAA